MIKFLATGERGGSSWFDIIQYITYVYLAGTHLVVAEDVERRAEFKHLRERIANIKRETLDASRAEILDGLLDRNRLLQLAWNAEFESQVALHKLKLRLKEMLKTNASDLEYETVAKEFAKGCGFDKQKASVARQFVRDIVKPNCVPAWMTTPAGLKLCQDVRAIKNTISRALENPDGIRAVTALAEAAIVVGKAKVDELVEAQRSLSKDYDLD